MNKSLLTIFCISLFFNIFAQTPAKYWVQFTDKNGSNYSVDKPEQFLSQRAIDKRNRFNIKITTTDLPVNEHYIAQIVALDTSIVVFSRSKWHNGITIYCTNDSILSMLNKLSFVQFTERTITMKTPEAPFDSRFYQSFGNNFAKPDNSISELDYGKSKKQIFINNAQWLHRLGYRGEGIQIMMLDGGFHNVDSIRHLQKLRTEGRLIGVRNYVLPAENPFRGKAAHGTGTLSCIASDIAGEIIGTAPKVSVFIAETEDGRSENKVEEDNWVAAIEWADSLGCDILNSSLGYTRFDDPTLSYTAADLTGKISRASLAATMGAERGIICCISAGNMGSNAWTYIGTPADAENVLTVGGIDINGNRAKFSSYNRSANKVIKPDACTVGIDVWSANPFSKTTRMSGTSFSSPLLAGMVSCLWQAFPQKSNYEIMEAVRKSCSNAVKPDTSMGYGIADMFKAYNILRNDYQNADIKIDVQNFILQQNPFLLTINALHATKVEISLTQKSNNFQYKKLFKLKCGDNRIAIKELKKIATHLDFEFLDLQISTEKQCFNYLLGVEKQEKEK